MIVFCPNCYAELKDASGDCFACGHPLNQIIEQPVEVSIAENADEQMPIRFAGEKSVVQPLRGLLIHNRYMLYEALPDQDEVAVWIVLDQQSVLSGRAYFWSSSTSTELIDHHRRIAGCSPVALVTEAPSVSLLFEHNCEPLMVYLNLQGGSLDDV